MTQAIDSVRVVLFEAGATERFLILTEADDPDNWKLPGGKFEPNETPAVAAQRELLEELGLAADDVQPRATAELLNDDGMSKRYIFAATINPHAIKPSREIAHTAWLVAAEVPDCRNHDHILSAVAAARG